MRSAAADAVCDARRMQMHDKGRALSRRFTVTKLVYRQRKHANAISCLSAVTTTCPSSRDGEDVLVSYLSASSWNGGVLVVVVVVEYAITNAFAETFLHVLVARRIISARARTIATDAYTYVRLFRRRTRSS